jgi:hypothetical protein
MQPLIVKFVSRVPLDWPDCFLFSRYSSSPSCLAQTSRFPLETYSLCLHDLLSVLPRLVATQVPMYFSVSFEAYDSITGVVPTVWIYIFLVFVLFARSFICFAQTSRNASSNVFQRIPRCNRMIRSPASSPPYGSIFYQLRSVYLPHTFRQPPHNSLSPRAYVATLLKYVSVALL